MITNIQNIDPIEFVEDCLGIKLLADQKEILKRMMRSTDKIYIYPWRVYGRPSIRMINEIVKYCLLINNDVDRINVIQ